MVKTYVVRAEHHIDLIIGLIAGRSNDSNRNIKNAQHFRMDQRSDSPPLTCAATFLVRAIGASSSETGATGFLLTMGASSSESIEKRTANCAATDHAGGEKDKYGTNPRIRSLCDHGNPGYFEVP